MNINPFVYGNTTAIQNFLNRTRPLRRVIGRIITSGQSSAVVGEPRIGKTSFLNYISDPSTREKLYGTAGEQMIFSFIDSHMLSQEFTPSQFWQQALVPLKTQLVDPSPDTPLSQQYQVCQDNHFGTFTLETLFRRLKQAEWRFVLLIDEFDALIHHQVLNSVEFFGGMRSLASRSGGSLALVIASRQPIHILNDQTQYLNPTGSPFFNIFAEVTLGPFPKKDIEKLLDRAGERFSTQDRIVIKQLAGGHPYLLQAAAAALWDAYEEEIPDAPKRRQYMVERLYREQDWHFADTWKVWSPETRKAFTTIALCSGAQVLNDRTFALKPFIQSLKDLTPELKDLEEAGLIAKDDSQDCGWRVEPQIMIWWLADELVRATRNTEQTFEQWLQAQEMEHWLTRQQRETIASFAQKSGEFLLEGAGQLLEAVAEGLGSGLAGG
ncbi:MAG: hypothetical protein F6J87_08055 [Spirulina sp. SIO3F2]|nr:hypothetical protein [Spirulina sp. SIO3F2]